MLSRLHRFEAITRKASGFDEREELERQVLHPFELRNIHHRLPPKVRTLFDDGYYPEATFEAFKFVDKEVQRLSKGSGSGTKLYMQVFSEQHPVIFLTKVSSETEVNVQEGYKFIFAGSYLAIRDPLSHEYDIYDNPDKCLDHLSLASMLLRRLEEAGYKIK